MMFVFDCAQSYLMYLRDCAKRREYIDDKPSHVDFDWPVIRSQSFCLTDPLVDLDSAIDRKYNYLSSQMSPVVIRSILAEIYRNENP